MDTRRFGILLAALVVLAVAAATAVAMVPMTAKVAHTALPVVEPMECSDPYEPHETITVVPAGYEVAPQEPQDDPYDTEWYEDEESEVDDGHDYPGVSDSAAGSDVCGSRDSDAVGTAADFRRDGVWYGGIVWVEDESCEDGGYWREFHYTWYSSNVLHHYRTGEWWTDEDGIYRDSDGYVVIACDLVAEGELFDTPFGMGKRYDCGCDGVDIYVCW